MDKYVDPRDTLYINGVEAVKGQKVTTFRGLEYTLEDWDPPHKPSAKGFVYLRDENGDDHYQYYASVVGGEFRPKLKIPTHCTKGYKFIVCSSFAGYYIGTFDPEEGPICQCSQEYYLTRAQAEKALEEGTFTIRFCSENEFCHQGMGCLVNPD